MSINLMSMAWRVKFKEIVPPKQASLYKLILMKICDNASDEGLCFPSIGNIAEMCDCSRTTVKERLSHLVGMGLITKEARYKNNKQGSNYYYVNITLLTELSSKKNNEGVALRPVGGRTATAQGVALRPQNRHLEPSIEPSNTGSGSNKNLTMNIDENLILSVWKVLKEFIGEKYGTRYIPKGNPKQEDINAIEWGLEIEQDLDDDSTGALFFDYCLERLGEPRNGATKNILLRSYRASLELNDEAWSLDYERYNLMLD